MSKVKTGYSDYAHLLTQMTPSVPDPKGRMTGKDGVDRRKMEEVREELDMARELGMTLSAYRISVRT